MSTTTMVFRPGCRNANSTKISSKKWTELGKLELYGKIRHLEAYDGHQLTLLVVQFDKEIGLPGRDLLPKHGVNNITTEHLPAVKGYKVHVKLIPGTQSMFCNARKKTLPLQDKVTEKPEQIVRQDILEQIQPRGFTNASPVVWQRKKSGELRLCVELKVHINGKVMDEDYPIPDMETIFHNLLWTSYFGKVDLSDNYYQIEIDEEAKDICTINPSQGLFKMCRLPQGLKNSSSIFQNCIKRTLKGIKCVLIFQDNVLVFGTSKEQFDKRMPAVKSRLRENIFYC